ncbi:MAG: hypothetical protein AB7O66_01650 [Limisphaerales bacterium]
MKPSIFSFLGLLTLLLASPSAPAGVSYPEPSGGWSYIYSADAGQDEFGGGADFDALDGTWSHTNGSDTWDGSGLGGTFVTGENAPGGAKIYSEDGVSYLRIQDTGDPRDFGFPDNGNRKVYLGHDISAHGAADDALDQGVTISFRARIPTPAKTTHPLDPLHRDGQGAAGPQPYPAGGDGYVTSDGGKGNFVIKQQIGGAFAFSLAVADDQGQGDPNSPKAGFTGLTMNEFNGNVNSGNVNFGQGTGTNVLALDPTDWHEFWIVLRKDPANIGTHEALIYVDGSTEARFFKITAGTGDDYGGIGYIAMGSTATPQSSALDVDFFAMKTEAVFPPGALANLPPEISGLSPASGTRYATAANGLSFTATTQPPNSIPTTGAQLILNGTDVTADLVASGDIRSRTFTYSKLQANQLYSGSIILADQTGRSSTNSVSFDTFAEGEIGLTPVADYSTPVDITLPSGRQQVYLYAGSPQPQTVRVDQVAGATASPLGVFLIPATGTTANPRFAALSDAFGKAVVLDGGGTRTLRLTPIGSTISVPSEIIVAPTSAAASAPYTGIVLPIPGSAALPDASVIAELVNGGGSIDAASIRVFVNDVDVTAASTRTPGSSGVSVRYASADFLPGGSVVSARVSFTAGGTQQESAWSFSVANVPRLNPSWATPASSVSGRPRGFTGRIHKPYEGVDAALFPNNPQRAEDQLAGRIIDPNTGEPFENEAVGEKGDGTFVETDTINYEQTGIDEGIPGDRQFPNLDAYDVNNLALEVITYLNLPRGAHRLAVACDDGFVVWAGPSASRTTNQFGIRSPGGGTVEATFDVANETAGVFAFRLIFFEGTGGADIEWYSVNPETGARTLINATGGILAYQSREGDGTEDATPPTVQLTAQRNGASIVLTWPKTTPAYRLESTPALVPAAWAAVPGSPTESGNSLTQTIPAGSGIAYFRLRSP